MTVHKVHCSLQGREHKTEPHVEEMNIWYMYMGYVANEALHRSLQRYFGRVGELIIDYADDCILFLY